MNYLISRRRLEVYWYLDPLAFQFCIHEFQTILLLSSAFNQTMSSIPVRHVELYSLDLSTFLLDALDDYIFFGFHTSCHILAPFGCRR